MTVQDITAQEMAIVQSLVSKDKNRFYLHGHIYYHLFNLYKHKMSNAAIDRRVGCVMNYVVTYY
jgi:hypothetical protein